MVLSALVYCLRGRTSSVSSAAWSGCSRAVPRCQPANRRNSRANPPNRAARSTAWSSARSPEASGAAPAAPAPGGPRPSPVRGLGSGLRWGAQVPGARWPPSPQPLQPVLLGSGSGLGLAAADAPTCPPAGGTAPAAGLGAPAEWLLAEDSEGSSAAEASAKYSRQTCAVSYIYTQATASKM